MNERCQRCQVLPRVTDEPKQLFCVFPLEVIKEKFKSFLKDHGCEFLDEGEFLGFEVENFKSFIVKLTGSNVFSSVELNDIHCVMLDKNTPLTVSAFKSLKPLSTWTSLVEAEEYLEMLADGRLTAYFQPVLDVKQLKVVGFEVLARGVGKDGSIVPPGQLFDWARKTDTLFYLDRACREIAVKTAAVKKLNNFLIFINFTPTAIYDPQFCLKDTVDWATQLHLDPKNLVFEVVESEKVEDLGHLKNILDYYRSKGFRVALDDVGSGYSNLNVIAELKPDIIKIDREIIRNVHEDKIKNAILEALVRIARECGIDVLAEGVETVEEFEFLRDKVDFAQGYFFGKPAPEPVRVVKI